MAKPIRGLVGVCACVLVTMFTACGDDDSSNGGTSGTTAGSGGSGGTGSGGTGGTAGSAGTGGTSGTGGTAGTAGSGGSAGTAAGDGGTGGVSGTGGVGGTAGSSGSGGTGGTSGAGGTSGTSGAGGTGGVASTTECTSSPWTPGDFNQVIEVGPGHAALTPSDVPWESIGPGTLVLIHARPTPYRDKWVLNVAATEANPVVVRGVPDSNGALPQIQGSGAVTRNGINFWGEERSVIKIGGSNAPNNDEPSHIFVECLDISGAREGNTYTGDDGNSHGYVGNAAAITIESGDHITLRSNAFHDCGNGLFAASASLDVKVIGNHIFDNGNVDSIYEHNSYTESEGILFEGNHYGPLCTGCPGNNLKDRSAGTVIRYNWIEGGNRQLDLVDSDHDELLALPSYNATFVYGNVLIEPDGAGNSQIIHYGGDSGTTDNYRKGTLHFFHNTVVSTRNGNTTLVRLSSSDETIDARNNVIYVSAAGTSLAITDGNGTANLRTNWLPMGYRSSHSTLNGTVNDLGNVNGTTACFTDLSTQDFSLLPTSECTGVAGPLATETAPHPLLLQIEAPTVLAPRPVNALTDIGAFER